MPTPSSMEYLSLLYKELTRKLETIHKYIDAIDNQVGDIYQSAYEGVYICKRKYEIVEDYKETTPKIHPQTEFAFEPRPNKPKKGDTGQDVQETIEDLNEDLKSTFAEINFRFSKQQGNLDNLGKVHLELQNIINEIFQNWKTLNGDEDKF